MVAAKGGGKNLLGRINSQDDISYGVYLYAFPIGKLIFWYAPALPLFSVGMLTFIGACVCGWLSWQLVEKPVMRLRSRPLIA